MAKTSFSAPDPSALLVWYDRHARDLPWRHPPHDAGEKRLTPYHTWLSEIMLQQTGVSTVIPYYRRFVARWPDVAALSRADNDAVLGEWAGLGYYSRARNLLACARQIAEQYNGIFPQDIATLKQLPGIGDYTANAIRAIAFDQPAVVVDGNVERVMARLFAVPEPASQPAGKKRLRALAAAVAPRSPDARHGDYAQALMDLGATICTPRQPLCGQCPWQQSCRARAMDKTAEYPVMQRSAPVPERICATYVIYDRQGRICLRRRPDKGLLAGLWECPSTPWFPVSGQSQDTENAIASCRDAIGASLPVENSLFPALFTLLPKDVRHIFSHFRLTVRIFVCNRPMDAAHLCLPDCEWFHTDALPALSTLARKTIRAAGLLAQEPQDRVE